MNEFRAASLLGSMRRLHAYRWDDDEPRALCSGLRVQHVHPAVAFDVNGASSCPACVAIIGQGGIQ